MEAEFTQDTILDFLKQRGGKVKNAELTEHFSGVFPQDPRRKAAVRHVFKNYVNNIAFVKSESGVKYVCLRKNFRDCPGTETEEASSASGDDAAADSAVHVRQQILPGSGYGNDRGTVPRLSPAPRVSVQEPGSQDCVRVGVDGDSGEMGNWDSVTRENKEQTLKAPDVPEIAVIEASPLPVEEGMFTLPEPAGADQVDPGPGGALQEPEPSHVTSEQSCKVSQEKFLNEDDSDARSLSGSEDSGTPRGSRRQFIQVMMNSSPQVRRSVGLRLFSRFDSDSASLVSTLEEDRTSVMLDPVEHEWMMCASDGEWGSLQRLLSVDPSLVLRKDFVTGFTCLHWAAKHGKPELIALIINFSKENNIPISVDVRSNAGYTPLHIAAMHSHMEVVKLLVGAYNADVEVRDFSGRKACQYLTESASVDIRDIIGAYEHSGSQDPEHRDRARWRFSKVLQSNLRVLKPGDSLDEEERPRGVILRRKSSLSRMKPNLQKLRMRTSQLVHSVSFRDKEDLDGSKDGSFKSRRKTNFFG